jgi:hypothetical protein
MGTAGNAVFREPWNKGKIVGQKAPFKLKDIWALRVRLQMEGRVMCLTLIFVRIGQGEHLFKGGGILKVKVFVTGSVLESIPQLQPKVLQLPLGPPAGPRKN